MIQWSDFEKVEMRVGTVLRVEAFPKARRPAYKLLVDLGEHGIKRSSAQITDLYEPDTLKGSQVIVVVNFPPKQIADFMSECLVLGVVGDPKGVVLLQPQQAVPNGLRIG